MNVSKMIFPALLAASLIGTAYTGNAFAMNGGMMGGKTDGGSMGCGSMGDGMGGGMMSGMSGGMAKHVRGQLKPEQIAQFDTMLKAFEKQVEPTQQALFVKGQELKALQGAATPDVKAVSKTATELVQLQSKLKAENDAFAEQVQKEFNIKDLHGGMGGMTHGGMGGMKHGNTDAQTGTAGGHEGHK